MSEPASFWRKCSSCKKEIPYSTLYWVCNVSTCNRKRTGLAFCAVSCWDAHVPQMNHRESWAEERKSPTAQEWARTLSGQGKSDDKPVRKRTEIEEVAAVKSAEPPAPASGPSKVLIRRSGGR